MRYTVILIYPDHVANNYGEDYYYAQVETATPKRALAMARAEALIANRLSSHKDDDNYCNPVDFACVALYPGHHDDVNPEK